MGTKWKALFALLLVGCQAVTAWAQGANDVPADGSLATIRPVRRLSAHGRRRLCAPLAARVIHRFTPPIPMSPIGSPHNDTHRSAADDGEAANPSPGKIGQGRHREQGSAEHRRRRAHGFRRRGAAYFAPRKASTARSAACSCSAIGSAIPASRFWSRLVRHADDQHLSDARVDAGRFSTTTTSIPPLQRRFSRHDRLSLRQSVGGNRRLEDVGPGLVSRSTPSRIGCICRSRPIRRPRASAAAGSTTAAAPGCKSIRSASSIIPDLANVEANYRAVVLEGIQLLFGLRYLNASERFDILNSDQDGLSGLRILCSWNYLPRVLQTHSNILGPQIGFEAEDQVRDWLCVGRALASAADRRQLLQRRRLALSRRRLHGPQQYSQ